MKIKQHTVTDFLNIKLALKERQKEDKYKKRENRVLLSYLPGGEQLVLMEGISAMLRCYLLPAAHENQKTDSYYQVSITCFDCLEDTAQMTNFLGSDLR